MKKLIITSLAVISLAGVTSYSLLTQPNEEQMKQTTNALTVDGYIEPVTAPEPVQAPEVVETVTNPPIAEQAPVEPLNEPEQPKYVQSHELRQKSIEILINLPEFNDLKETGYAGEPILRVIENTYAFNRGNSAFIVENFQDTVRQCLIQTTEAANTAVTNNVKFNYYAFVCEL